MQNEAWFMNQQAKKLKRIMKLNGMKIEWQFALKNDLV